MHYPDFFDSIEPLALYDELAQFLGVNEEGLIEISYLDIVKTAGHSCATVAGAYLMAQHGLKELFGSELPKRGEIKVELKRMPTEENSGVVGCVLSNITGATTDYGFGGIPTGKFNRRGLLYYGVAMQADVRFTRIDTQESVEVHYYPKRVVDPMSILMSAIGKDAKPEDIESFPTRFQEMVRTVFENAQKVIEVKRV